MSLLRPRADQKQTADTDAQAGIKRKKAFLTPVEMTVFAMLGALMYCSKIIMEWAPNIHLLGMFTMVFTLTYRKKGLIPLYVYVLLNGLYAGFATWWLPYLYLWAVLWGITMLLPRKMPLAVATIVYALVCGLHGLGFGTLYAPAQALLFGLNFKQTLSWIAAGFPWDIMHGIGNFAAGFLIIPLCRILKRLDKNAVGLSF